MRDVDIMTVADVAMAKIKNGVFLTVSDGEQRNTMTIGWATFGFCWRKPILMIAVRDSRHTFSIIEKAADFTISIPSQNMRDEIMFCGTKSGRDVDKFEVLGLKAGPSRQVASPIIQVSGLHLECKIVYKTAMNPDLLTPEYEGLYPEKDYHTLYFGEIQACYELS